MATIDQSTFESINNTNFKALAEMGTINALQHQNRVNVIAEQGLAMFVKNMQEVDVLEAKASTQALSGHATADTLTQMGAVVSGIQQLVKAAQTTRPETGAG